MRSFSARAFRVGTLALVLGTPLAATVVPFVWTGSSGNSRWTTSTNWLGGGAPSSDGTAAILFQPGAKNFVEVDTPADVSSLSFVGLTGFFSLQAEIEDSATIIVHDGINLSPSSSAARVQLGGEEFTDFTIALAASQTWAVFDGTLAVYASITEDIDEAVLTKLGLGTLHLAGDNSYTGGTVLESGTLSIATDTALGTGALTIAPDTIVDFESSGPTLIVAHDDGLLLDNDLVLNGAFRVAGRGDLTLTGTVTLNEGTVFQPRGILLDIEGPISGTDSRLTLNGPGALVLRGNNTYDGGTQADQGILVFTSATTIPVSGDLTALSLGYLGYGVGTNVQTDFLDKFDKVNTTGALGFDHDLDLETPLSVTSPLDLTGFAATARLGSATSAILQPTAIITPQVTNTETGATDYRFGGGSGTLTVASQLSDRLTPTPAVRNVVADSPAELPLTVRLINTTNTFTGTVAATHSAVIFGPGVPLPAGTGNFLAGPGGYIGSEDAAVTPVDFLAHFPTTTTGLIGFDQAPNALGARTVDLTGVNLAAFSSGVFLGTTSFRGSDAGGFTPGVVFSGTIAPGAGDTHRFAGYKGGFLELAGNLTGAQLILGQPDTPATFGDFNGDRYSTVLVSGNSATKLTGGTTFYGGRLIVGQAAGDGVAGTDHTHALGEGPLKVSPVNFFVVDPDGGTKFPAPRLEAAVSGLILVNPIQLEQELNIGGQNNLVLAGAITGPGELYVGEDSITGFTLRLEGDNAFTGGIYLGSGTRVELATDTAAGTGTLAFGFSGGVAEFESAAPTIGGLASHALSGQVNLAPDSTLTINQAGDTKFDGSISGDGASIIKDGTGTLRLEGSLGHTGDTTIRAGTLVASADQDSSDQIQLGTGTVRLEGGTLVLAAGTFLDNTVALTAGTLAGGGAFDQVTLGAGAILSPGLTETGAIGTLRFDHLALGSGGEFVWHLRDPAEVGDAFTHDQVVVQSTASLTLDLLANTLINPFLIRPVSLNSAGANGIINGLDPGAGSVSWTLISYDQIIGAQTLFNPANFSLQLDQFHTSLAGTLNLELTSLTGSGQLLLTFTPVPEPSTTALLLTGLALAALGLRRRRG